MNCKPGDLAIVIASDIPENIGLFVDVIEADDPDKHRFGIALLNVGQVWQCRARGQITYRDLFGRMAVATEGPIPDSALRPIRPPEQDTNVNTEKELEVTA